MVSSTIRPEEALNPKFQGNEKLRQRTQNGNFGVSGVATVKMKISGVWGPLKKNDVNLISDRYSFLVPEILGLHI